MAAKVLVSLPPILTSGRPLLCVDFLEYTWTPFIVDFLEYTWTPFIVCGLPGIYLDALYCVWTSWNIPGRPLLCVDGQ